MKKTKRILFIVLGFIFIVFILPNISNYYKNISLLFEKKYEKEENYKFLHQYSSNSNFDFRAFNTTSSNTRVFKINDSLNVISISNRHQFNRDLDFTYSWYKINNNGLIIDSLFLKNEDVYRFGNYLVNREKSYYLTWFIDGSTKPMSFTLIEDGKIINKKDFVKYTNNIDFSYSDWQGYDENKRYKTVYFKNDKWYEIYTKESQETSPKREYGQQSLTFNPIDKISTLDYFYKQEWRGETFPNLNLHLNGKRPDHWKGTGYYTALVNNKKLHFKRGGLQLTEDNHIRDTYTLSIYENTKKTYSIISDINYGGYLYLIRYK